MPTLGEGAVTGRAKDVRCAHARPAPLVNRWLRRALRSVLWTRFLWPAVHGARPSGRGRCAVHASKRRGPATHSVPGRESAPRTAGIVPSSFVAAAGQQERLVLARSSPPPRPHRSPAPKAVARQKTPCSSALLPSRRGLPCGAPVSPRRSPGSPVGSALARVVSGSAIVEYFLIACIL